MEKSQRRVAATGGWWIFHGNVRLHWLSSVNWWYQAGGHCTAKGHPLVAEEEGSGKETAESSFFHWENEWLVRWNMVYFCFTGLFPSTFCWSLASRSAWICLGSFWSLYCLDTRECYVNFIYIYIHPVCRRNIAPSGWSFLSLWSSIIWSDGSLLKWCLVTTTW